MAGALSEQNMKALNQDETAEARLVSLSPENKQ